MKLAHQEGVQDLTLTNRWAEEEAYSENTSISREEIKEITLEIIEESGILNSKSNIEEQLNILIKQVDKQNQPWYKAVFISIITTLILTLFNPILEPIEKEYTAFVEQNGRMLIKKIQNKVHTEYGDISGLKEYKIVSTDELVIRTTNKKNSRAIEKLNFGQLVKVIKKNRNWTLIMYENKDGEQIVGWVFTRYLSNITY